MPQPIHSYAQGFAGALRRTRPDLWMFAGVVALLNLHLIGIGSPRPFVFFPAEAAAGQWWRLFTHPFVHLTFYHLALDAGAFFILYAGLAEGRLFRKLSFAAVAGLSSLTAALVLVPELERFGLCGLSGTAHGLMAVSGLEMICEKRHRLVGWISFGSVAAKSVFEAANGAVLFEFMHMGLCGTPIAACHLGGVAGAAVMYFLFRAADRFSPIAFRNGAWVHHAARLYARLCYRVGFAGAKRFPKSGAALIVANHVSYVDPILIAAACRRPIRFVMHAPYYRLPVLNLFFRAVGAIPISPSKKEPGTLRRSMREIEKALDNGELVCIFPEGRLSRNGTIGRFLSGVERIVRRTPVPVVPVTLSGMWGSVFSYRFGRPLKHLPRRFRAQVTVSVSDPVPPAAASASRLRWIVSAGCAPLDAACDRTGSVTKMGYASDATFPAGKEAVCCKHRC